MSAVHDAAVSEATLMRAKLRFQRMGLKHALHGLLGAEPFLGYYLLDELTEIAHAAGGSKMDIHHRTEEMTRVVCIALEAMRLGLVELWTTDADASQ